MSYHRRGLNGSALSVLLGLTAMGAAGVCGCNSEITGADTGDLSSGGGGGGGGGGGAVDMSPFNRDAACAAVRAETTLTKKPVDIIIVVDNSGSMTDEIQGVEKNINQNFASVLESSGLDYRVILISKHGKSSPDESICISPPLSQNPTCSPPPTKPINGTRFFHYDIEVDSYNSLATILSTYNTQDVNKFTTKGWSEWLRADAIRFFLEITDDNASPLTSKEFDTQLLALTPKSFGTAAARNYVFHTIAGLKENSPATTPWPPNAALQSTKCTNGTGAVNAGTVYQELSILTGGLRFPICEFANFDGIFKELAKGVVAGAKVACDFAVPAAPPNQKVNLDTVVVEYTPGGVGAAQSLKKVAGVATCAPGSFYIEANRIYLCPAACTTVQADAKAKLQVLFDCTFIVG